MSMAIVDSRFFFFFNDTATTEIYTLSLHDALPISPNADASFQQSPAARSVWSAREIADRKSTRLNSSHGYISYAVFCLKKKKNATRVLPPLRRAVVVKRATPCRNTGIRRGTVVSWT